jgi:uncharacterized membrane protein YeaQ/YmgE (transglycosylase-associated protein family)
MGVLSWIVIGLIAGWLAHEMVDRRSSGLPNNLAVGLVGGVVGGFGFTYLSGAARPGFLGSLLTATIGAVILLLIWRAIRRA